jgi:hypothetical protein
MSDDPRHGFTSASSAEADSLCAGRHLAQKAVPLSDNGSKDAEHGQLVHDALAGKADGATLDHEQLAIYDQCKAIETKLVADYFGPIPLTQLREQRFWIQFHVSNGSDIRHSGQADYVARCGIKALIIDYKSLYGDTAESPRNMQLRDLACLVRNHFVLVNEVAVAIVQPLVTMEPELCVYGETELWRALTEMERRVIRSNQPDSERVAGEVQCKFCRAKAHCLEYQQWVGTMLPVLNTLNLMEVPVAQWTPEQRSRAADLLKPAMDFLESVKGSIKEGLAVDPNFCPGWTLKPGAKREEIINPQITFDRFTALGGKLQDFMGCLSVEKGALAARLATLTGLKGKALDRALAELHADNVTVKRNAPSLKKV